MLILALDTAGRVASAALCRDGRVEAHCERDSMMDHSRTILPVCEQMLREQGLTLRDIDVFAAVCGPGSYTGIRIGVAAVKGFAFALERRCAAVSSLESAAWADRLHAGEKLAVLAARPGEYFAARFSQGEGAPVRLTPDAVMDLEQLRGAVLGGCARLCGSGARQACHALGISPDAAGAEGTAQSAALCAFDKALHGQTLSCHELTPSYLRPTQAERMKMEKEGKQQ